MRQEPRGAARRARSGRTGGSSGPRRSSRAPGSARRSRSAGTERRIRSAPVVSAIDTALAASDADLRRAGMPRFMRQRRSACECLLRGRQRQCALARREHRRARQRELSARFAEHAHADLRQNLNAGLISGEGGERGGTRTRDHLIKSQVLYQLSYAPSIFTHDLIPKPLPALGIMRCAGVYGRVCVRSIACLRYRRLSAQRDAQLISRWPRDLLHCREREELNADRKPYRRPSFRHHRVAA